jgi:hypothetical protein
MTFYYFIYYVNKMDGWGIVLLIVGVFALVFLVFLFLNNYSAQRRYAAAKSFRSGIIYASDPSDPSDTSVEQVLTKYGYPVATGKDNLIVEEYNIPLVKPADDAGGPSQSYSQETSSDATPGIGYSGGGYGDPYFDQGV